MALCYKCPHCQSEIMLRYVEIGETANCSSCGNKSIVPQDASTINEDEAGKRFTDESKTRKINKNSKIEKLRNVYSPEDFPKREAAIAKWMPRFWGFLIIGMLILYLRIRLGWTSPNIQVDEGYRSLLSIIPQTICFLISLNIFYFANNANPIKGFGSMASLVNMVRKNQLKYLYILVAAMAVEEIVLWILNLV